MKHLTLILIVLLSVLPACGGPVESRTAAEQALANLDKAWRDSYAALKMERDGLVKAHLDAMAARDATIADLRRQLAAATVPKPAPGATYTVSATGNIQDAIDKAKAGQVVTVAPGTRKKHAPLVVREGVTLDLTGVTLDGEGNAAPAVAIKAGGTLKGGTITGYVGENDRAKAVVKIVGDDATVSGVTISKCSGAAIGGDNVQRPRVANNTITDTGGSWILLGGGEKGRCQSPVITGNTVERFNLDKHLVGSGPGTNKMTRTVNATIADNTIRDGFGAAIYLDIDHVKPRITGNKISGLKPVKDPWDTAGIYIEISNCDGGIVDGNTIINLTRGTPAITIAESNGLTVSNNTVTRGLIEVRDVRYSPPKERTFTANYDGRGVKDITTGLRNVTFSGNKAIDGAKLNHISGAGYYGGKKTEADRRAYLNSVGVTWK